MLIYETTCQVGAWCMLVSMCVAWSMATPSSTTASSISTTLHCAGSRHASFTTCSRHGCGCLVCSFSYTGDNFHEGNTYWGSNACISPVYLWHFYIHDVWGNKTKVKGKIRKVSVNILMLHTLGMLVSYELNFQLISNIVIITIVVVVALLLWLHCRCVLDVVVMIVVTIAPYCRGHHCPIILVAVVVVVTSHCHSCCCGCYWCCRSHRDSCRPCQWCAAAQWAEGWLVDDQLGVLFMVSRPQ